MKTLIVLTAVPGAGKSTWANDYQRTHQHTFVVSSDAIRVELFGDRRNFSNETKVWRLFRERIHEYARQYDDVTVILDAINAKNEYRQEFVEKTPEFDQHLLVYICKPISQVLAQNSKRAADEIVPPEIIMNYFQRIEEPNSLIKELFNHIETVS